MQLQSSKEAIKRESDKYLFINTEDMLSLSELCKELSISVATGRNWIKLGKLIPSAQVKRVPYFTYDEVKQIKLKIQNKDSTALKSRRNKKYISGNNIYNSYVSDDSVNISIIQSVLNEIEQKNIELSEEVSLALVADCAVRWILSRTNKVQETEGLSKYLSGEYKNNPFMFLIDDLLEGYPFIAVVLENFPELFHFQYVFEENEDILGLLYLSLNNIGNRKATGAYYTPTTIVKKLCEKLFSMNLTANKTIFDPCCGTGNFLLQLPDTVDYHQVFGNDIDIISAKIARINYALKYMIHDKSIISTHITIQDYLLFSSEKKFDIIIGNPPWGYDYSEEQKEFLRERYSFAAGSNIESYDVFIEQAFGNLNLNGILSFVLPEAILNVKSHTPIRTLILKKASFQYLGFLGNAFDKVQCPCIILQMIYTNMPFDSRGLIVDNGNCIFTVQEKRAITAEYFSLDITDEEYGIINKMDSLHNKITLLEKAVFALGIVTGNNKKYISTQKRMDNERVLKGSDLCKYKFGNTDNYIEFKPELFQQVAPVEYYRADEKLLYRFICNQLVFAYDNQRTLSLNSCNILIPQIQGLHIKYILAVLNSRIAQFYFRKKFQSVKVLRSHIEQIPIPFIEMGEQERIIQLVEELLDTMEENAILNLYNEIDYKIAEFFGLSKKEYGIIQISMEGENLFLS
jgi:type I restriction-modification system DNA methylase subunit